MKPFLRRLTHFCFVAILGASASMDGGCGTPRSPRDRVPQRIVTTSPSVTETLFALGLGERVVGVSRFCRFPPETTNIPKVGGLLDRDHEGVLRLEPDLVVELEENDDACRMYRRFGVEVMTVDHRSLEGVFDSFVRLGKRFGPETSRNAETLLRETIEALDAVKNRTKHAAPPRVLICADRERGTGRLLSVYLAGKSPHYEAILKYAGGVNVAAGASVPYPLVSVEEIARMNPEVIVDLCVIPPDTDATDGKSDWKTLGETVEAVRNDRIYVLTEDYMTIPGPRLPQAVRRFAEVLHPGVFEEPEPQRFP